MRIVILGLTAAIAMSAAPAYAASREGAYWTLSAGSNVGGETAIEASATSIGTVNGQLDNEPGFVAALAFGNTTASGLSVEGEVLFSTNNMDTAEVTAVTGIVTDASVKTNGVLVNVLYDLMNVGPATVTVGGGVGYGVSRYKFDGAVGKSRDPVWQLIAGVSVPVTDTFSLEGKYRYLQGPKFSGEYDDGTEVYTLDMETHSSLLTVGGRFKF